MRLFKLAVFLSILWGASAIPTLVRAEIESDLYSIRFHYGMPVGAEPLAFMAGVVDSLSKRLSAQGGAPSPRLHLDLGDALHWLGHLLEDLHMFQDAQEVYARSEWHYRRSKYKTSAKINHLHTRDHAVFHLKKLPVAQNLLARYGTTHPDLCVTFMIGNQEYQYH